MSNFDMEINELSSKIFQDKLTKMNERNDQRKAVENHRRKERFEFGSHAEQAEVFSETFKEHQRRINLELTIACEAALSGESRITLTKMLDDIFKLIDALKKYLTESSMFLTAFDNEQAKIEFQEIMNNFNNIRDSLLPKKKFGFNSKPKLANSSTEPKPEPILKNEEKPKSKFNICEFGFFDTSNETLRLSDDKVNFKDLTLRNLSQCKIYLIGHPGSVYIHKVIDSIVVCGPISGSIFIEDCKNTTFYFACQQGRIHNTHNCSFYIHVTSRAIIEDCHDIRFGPFLLEYPTLVDDFNKSNLNIEMNNWDKIEDFRHLSVDCASPNWSIICESDRKVLKID